MEDRSEADYFRALKRLLVIALVGFALLQIVGMFANLNGTSRPDHGNIAVAKAQIKQFDMSLAFYKEKFGEYPPRLDGLFKPPSGDPIMNAKAVPLDPWGNEYQYLMADNEGYLVISLGADGEPGGDGADADIRSDEITKEVDK